MPWTVPKTTAEACSSRSISQFAANRIRVRCARTVSPSSGSVSSRKSSSPRRQTTSGAITRAFAVRSSASQASPATTSLETIRCRKSAASGPFTRTNARGRRAAFVVTLCTRPRLDTVFRSKAERKVQELGYDPARLPPGQYLTEKWPVLHAGSVPHTDLATWDFRVFGAVEDELVLSYGELQALPQTEITADIHCVTRWSRFDATFRGVRWRDLSPRVRPRPEARFVVAHAEQGFTSNVP